MADAAAQSRYAAGLPRVGERALEDHELRWLQRRLVHLRRGVIVALAAIVASAVAVTLARPWLQPQLSAVGGAAAAWLGAIGLCGVLGCLLGARGGWRILAAIGSLYLLGMAAVGALDPQLVPRPRGIDAAVVVGMILLGTSFVAHALLRRLAVLRHRSAIEADLAAGLVERYVGVVGQRPAAVLRHLGALTGDPEPVRLDLLPRSGIVVRVAGRRHPRWDTVHVADVAPTRPHALRVGLPAELVPAGGDPRLRLERRSLSPEERAELAAHASRLQRHWGPVAAVTIAVVAVAGWRLTHAAAWSDAFDLVDLAWYALLAVAWLGYVRRLRAAHKLRCDERLRWVVTVHDADAEHETQPPKLEVLPVSQLAWTEHARPAPWRTEEV